MMLVIDHAHNRSPLLAHLDAQLSALRNELSTVYRTQAASQNRQLSLSDALRDRDEEVRGLREEVRELREARDAGERRERDWEDRWKARTKDMEVGRNAVSFLTLRYSMTSFYPSILNSLPSHSETTLFSPTMLPFFNAGSIR